MANLQRNYPVNKKPVVREEKKPELPPNGTFWKCGGCGADNFGKFVDGVLHIKYRERLMTASGIITVTCRMCGAVNTIDLESILTKLMFTLGLMNFRLKLPKRL